MERIKYRAYTTRKFKEELHARMKVLAATRRVTIEEIFNELVEQGLNVLEAKLVAEQSGKVGC